MRAFVIITAGLVGACSVGPDFERPSAPATEKYIQGDAAANASEQVPVMHFTEGAPVPARWWESFQCAALNELVQDALEHSPTVLEARARLKQAQENLEAETRGTRYPSLDAQLGVTRQKVDPAAFGFPNVPPAPPFTLYNAQVNVNYSLDLFGINRRMVEGTRAQTEYQSYESQAAELTLAANVVAAAIRQADLQAQVEYTEEILQAGIRQLAINEERYRAGGISLEQLQGQRNQIEQLRATLPPLKAQRQQIDHQLAVYTGKPVAEAAIPRFSLKDLTTPAEVPLTLPSDLVRRRPDVRASEALWHEAAADVGVATANMLPSFTISGYAGSDRTNASNLVDSFNVWSIGAKMLQPIFHAGELRAKKRSAVDAYDAAAQAYGRTVLESLQQVADGLRALEADALTVQARTEASKQSSASYTIAKQRFDMGGVSELSLLDAKRQDLQSMLDRRHAEAQRLSDTAALLHALAGPV
jgi:NodT family efflux transporter outer membrane factor (OMF) lipoprotein